MVKGIEKGKSKSIEGRFSFEMESSRERGTHSRTWSLSEPETAASGSPITRSSKRRSYHERIPTQPPSPKQRAKKEVEAHDKKENVDEGRKPKPKEKHPTRAGKASVPKAGPQKRRDSKGVSSEYEFAGMHHIFAEHTRAVNVRNPPK